MSVTRLPSSKMTREEPPVNADLPMSLTPAGEIHQLNGRRPVDEVHLVAGESRIWLLGHAPGLSDE